MRSRYTQTISTDGTLLFFSKSVTQHFSRCSLNQKFTITGCKYTVYKTVKPGNCKTLSSKKYAFTQGLATDMGVRCTESVCVE